MCPHSFTWVCKSVEASSALIWGRDYSSLTAALIDLIFCMHTHIRSIGVIGYINLTFEVIKGHKILKVTKYELELALIGQKAFFSFYSQLKVKGALKFGI